MQSKKDFIFQGIPDTVKSEDAAICRSRLSQAIAALMERAQLNDIRITVGTPSLMVTPIKNEQKRRNAPGEEELSTEDRVIQYQPRKPLYTFEQLVVSEELLEELLIAVETIQVEPLVFNQWGLRKIEPYPRAALNLHGQPGTGKTLAAHAIANRLQRDILPISYAEIESKYVGDGPKNVQAVFLAAERSEAILFIDEADSLLSRRLTNVTQGAEQAINSMRSQLLLCLDQFHGIVIFATNLVTNYDPAFETRIYHIHFPLPDTNARLRLWKQLLVPELPVYDISFEVLATTIDNVCGRDIKNAIISAAVQAARQHRDGVSMHDLIQALQRIKASRILQTSDPGPASNTSTREESVEIGQRISASLANKKDL